MNKKITLIVLVLSFVVSFSLKANDYKKQTEDSKSAKEQSDPTKETKSNEVEIDSTSTKVKEASKTEKPKSIRKEYVKDGKEVIGFIMEDEDQWN